MIDGIVLRYLILLRLKFPHSISFAYIFWGISAGTRAHCICFVCEVTLLFLNFVLELHCYLSFVFCLFDAIRSPVLV